jgi:Reverse transcriptase (RNA-dependent DNA polymerase)/Pol polyprotein, beta-barrel domain
MASEVSKMTTTVVLTSPDNWDLWLSDIRRIAKAYDIWDHINPDFANSTDLVEPPKPSPQDLFGRPIEQLDEGQRIAWKDHIDNHKRKLEQYDRKKKAMANLEARIGSTVSLKCQKMIQKLSTAKEILVRLRERVAPTDYARELNVTSRLRKHLAIQRNSDVLDWIDQYESILEDAKELNIPDVQNGRDARDFIQAVKAYDSQFAGYWSNTLEVQLKEGKPVLTAYKLAQHFRDQVRVSLGYKTNMTKATFAAVFQGEKAPSERRSSTSTKNGNESNPDKPKNGWRPKCLCSERHYYTECAYLNQKARPAGWTGDPTVMASINEAMEKDPDLRPRINRKLEATERAKARSGASEEMEPKSGKSTAAAATCAVSLRQQPQYEAPQASVAAVSPSNSNDYQLRDSFILDSGSDTNICINQDRFTTFYPVQGEVLRVGGSYLHILGRGTIQLHMDTPQGPAMKDFDEVLYVPDFHVSVISFQYLRKKGIHWDTERNILHTFGQTLYYLREIADQFVIEYNEPTPSQQSNCFAAAGRKQALEEVTALRLHQRFGHISTEALKQLPLSRLNLTLIGPWEYDCEPCRLAKAKKVISRQPPTRGSARPCWRLYYDLFFFESGMDGTKIMLLFKCDWSGHYWAVRLPDRTGPTLLQAVKHVVTLIERQYKLQVCILKGDNEPGIVKDDNFTAWRNDKGILLEPAPSSTKEPVGHIERAGGVIKDIARAMKIASGLPNELWPWIVESAVKIYNRMPRFQNHWSSPIETVFKFLKDHNLDVPEGDPLAGINFITYGCKAYELKEDLKKPAAQKTSTVLDPRAYIGYLVGYESSNTYQIWIPENKRVVHTRDVTFKEDEFFDTYRPRRTVDIQEVEEIQDTIEVGLPSDSSSASDTEDSEELEAHSTDTENPDPESTIDQIKDQADLGPDSYQPYPTPTGSAEPEDQEGSVTEVPAEALISDTSTREKRKYTKKIYGPATRYSRRQTGRDPDDPEEGPSSDLGNAFAAFSMGTKYRLHRRDLPPEPQNYHEARRHPLWHLLKSAMDQEYQTLESRGTFQHVMASTISEDTTVLPTTWVYKYKFDRQGYLVKVKARLCVRGDLQPFSEKDTYAATLAGKSFRALMAIAARWNLEARQCDAVNAFTNSLLDEIVYIKCPDGFKHEGWVILLQRALYGLRRSPLLWQQDLAQTFKELDLQQGSEEVCIFNNDWLTVFVYVDDIVFLYRKKDEDKMNAFQKRLFEIYNMKDLGPLRWFLGIRVVRDRQAQKIYLCQDAYIEKVAVTYGLHNLPRKPKTPLPTTELKPFDGKATASFTHLYQRKVGSLNYASIITRPDVAYSASTLAKFLTNPSEDHMKAADQAISYLDGTRFQAICFGPEELDDKPDSQIVIKQHLVIASDAAFADDSVDRKSTQGHLITLYGGPVSWKSSKQSIITGSTTEAELLALANTTKEAFQLFRIFRDMQYNPDAQLKVFCDNQQALRLVKNPSLRLQTALKHVDVPHLWLRQEVQAGHVFTEYLPTSDMPADGLTKALPRGRLEVFRRQLGLTDIEPLIYTLEEDTDNNDKLPTSLIFSPR